MLTSRTTWNKATDGTRIKHGKRKVTTEHTELFYWFQKEKEHRHEARKKRVVCFNPCLARVPSVAKLCPLYYFVIFVVNFFVISPCLVCVPVVARSRWGVNSYQTGFQEMIWRVVWQFQIVQINLPKFIRLSKNVTTQ